jgi:D-threo-aldose 1-dehydrogenase
MKRNQIGQTSVSVTTLGFGGAPVGNLFRSITDDEAEGAIVAAWDAGVRYFDTAPHYGLGLSERRLGTSLDGRARGDFVISTKVGRLLSPNPSPTGSDLAVGGFEVPDDLTRTLDYSSDGVRRSIEESLGRLGMDYLDVVYVHDPDHYVDEVIRVTFPALVKMRDEGLVKAIGAGMNFSEPLLEFVRTSDIDVVMLAGRWTLLDRTGERLLDECRRRGVAVVSAAPFNSGLLSRPWPSSEAHFDYDTVSPELLARARAIAERCEAYGVMLPEVAINFPLRHDAVVSVVAGFRTAEQARTGAAWMDAKIPIELWDELEAGTS